MKSRLKVFGIFICIFVTANCMAQAEIKFDSISFTEARQKASAEKKLIFMDCFTSWCAPCKWMDKNVFNQASVANYYNSSFINTRFDMEKGEGVDLKNKYNIASYPTYLFLNEKGEVVHKAASRMEAEEFLTVGQNANNPQMRLSVLKQEYAEGKRDISFLLDYYEIARASNRALGNSLTTEISDLITDEQLGTSLGWRAIELLANTETDKFGKYFFEHKKDLGQFTTPKAMDSLENHLRFAGCYALIRQGNDAEFWNKLTYFSNSTDPVKQTQSIMLKADYYLSNKKYSEFNTLAKQALNGVLKNDANNLCFLARRANYKGLGDPSTFDVAYQLVLRAVEIAPNDYSNQSTLAQVCLSLHKKEEALTAANKALGLAETTKIEGIVKKLIDQINAL